MAAQIGPDLEAKVANAMQIFNQVVSTLNSMPANRRNDPVIQLIASVNQICANLIGAFNVLIRDNKPQAGRRRDDDDD